MTAMIDPRPNCCQWSGEKSGSIRGAKVGRRSSAQEISRARRLLHTEIEFIPSPEFRDRNARTLILQGSSEVDEVSDPEKSVPLPHDLPAHLLRLCDAKLLTAAQERQLFRRMNYLKFQANSLRSALDPDNLEATKLEEAERLLGEARKVRDRIVRANIRLVISIVKKFVTPTQSFDEILSDGILTLMNTVDKFDYNRGFRFSTYAYRSIARNAYRAVMARQRDARRFSNAAEETLDVEDSFDPAAMDERTWESLHGQLAEMMQRLDPRERLIIRSRFGLGEQTKPMALQALADELGISKERVRQLEQRAMAKLRLAATDLKLLDNVANE